MNKWITTKSGKRIKIQKKSNWISVKDRLPEMCTDVIVCNENGRVYSAWYNYGDNSWLYAFTAEIITHKVTHWMPLPEPPKEDDAEWIDNKCSVCGKGIENLIESREWYENEKPNYCPFCGIRL